MMPRAVPVGDCTLGLPLQLTPKVQRPICFFETHVEEAQDICSNQEWGRISQETGPLVFLAEATALMPPKN
jgi:hypothetical protein